MTTLPSDPNELRAKSMHLTIVGERFDLTATDIVYTFGVFAGPVKWTLRLTYDDFVRHHDAITEAYGKQTATASSVGKGNTVSFTAPVVCELPKLTGKVYIRPHSTATGQKRLPKLEYYLQRSVADWAGWRPVEAVDLPSPVPPFQPLLFNKHVATFLKVHEHLYQNIADGEGPPSSQPSTEVAPDGDVAAAQGSTAKPTDADEADDWVVVDDSKPTLAADADTASTKEDPAAETAHENTAPVDASATAEEATESVNASAPEQQNAANEVVPEEVASNEVAEAEQTAVETETPMAFCGHEAAEAMLRRTDHGLLRIMFNRWVASKSRHLEATEDHTADDDHQDAKSAAFCSHEAAEAMLRRTDHGLLLVMFNRWCELVTRSDGAVTGYMEMISDDGVEGAEAENAAQQGPVDEVDDTPAMADDKNDDEDPIDSNVATLREVATDALEMTVAEEDENEAAQQDIETAGAPEQFAEEVAAPVNPDGAFDSDHEGVEAESRADSDDLTPEVDEIILSRRRSSAVASHQELNTAQEPRPEDAHDATTFTATQEKEEDKEDKDGVLADKNTAEMDQHNDDDEAQEVPHSVNTEAALGPIVDETADKFAVSVMSARSELAGTVVASVTENAVLRSADECVLSSPTFSDRFDHPDEAEPLPHLAESASAAAVDAHDDYECAEVSATTSVALDAVEPAAKEPHAASEEPGNNAEEVLENDEVVDVETSEASPEVVAEEEAVEEVAAASATEEVLDGDFAEETAVEPEEVDHEVAADEAAVEEAGTTEDATAVQEVAIEADEDEDAEEVQQVLAEETAPAEVAADEVAHEAAPASAEAVEAVEDSEAEALAEAALETNEEVKEEVAAEEAEEEFQEEETAAEDAAVDTKESAVDQAEEQETQISADDAERCPESEEEGSVADRDGHNAAADSLPLAGTAASDDDVAAAEEVDPAIEPSAVLEETVDHADVASSEHAEEDTVAGDAAEDITADQEAADEVVTPAAADDDEDEEPEVDAPEEPKEEPAPVCVLDRVVASVREERATAQVRAKIVKFALAKSGDRIDFDIQVSLNGRTWVVQRRFKQLLALHQTLLATFPAFKTLVDRNASAKKNGPNFNFESIAAPFWKKKSDEVSQKRMAFFQQYLRMVICLVDSWDAKAEYSSVVATSDADGTKSELELNVVVAEFLEVEKNMKGPPRAQRRK